MPHAFRHLLLRECPSRGHKEDLRVTPLSQPRSGGGQGHTQLEKRRGPSPAAPAGRQSPAEAPLQEEALCWGRTGQPTGWQEGGGTPWNETCHCPEACLSQTRLTDGPPGGSVVTRLQRRGRERRRWAPRTGRSPGVGNGDPFHYPWGLLWWRGR